MFNKEYAYDGERYITPSGDFVTVDYDPWATNPREDDDTCKLYVWDNDWYTRERLDSPDEAPSILDLVEDVMSYNDEILPMWDENDANGAHSEWEWLFDLEQMPEDNEFLPNVISLLRKRGVRCWPLLKDYYGNDTIVSIVEAPNMRALKRYADEIVGIAIPNEEVMYEPNVYEWVRASVNEYSSWLLGSGHYVNLYNDPNDCGPYDCCGFIGNIDGSVDFDVIELPEDSVEVLYDYDEWAEKVRYVREVVEPVVGYIDVTKAMMALYVLERHNCNVPSRMGERGWVEMMKAIAA